MEDQYDLIDMNQLRKQTLPEYFQTLDSLSGALDANEEYNAGKPGHVPVGNTFRQHKSEMQKLSVGADRGDTLLIEQRQAARIDSDHDIDAAVSYLKTIAIAKKDPTILRATTLPLKDNHQKKASKTAPSPLAVMIVLEARRVKGKKAAIVINGRHVRNGGPYLLNLCKGKPVSEESWYNPGGHYNSCREIVIGGLEPANEYWVRMRVDRPEGQGDWSQPVSIIVT